MKTTRTIVISKYRLSRNSGMELCVLGRTMDDLVEQGTIISYSLSDVSDNFIIEVPRLTELTNAINFAELIFGNESV